MWRTAIKYLSLPLFLVLVLIGVSFFAIQRERATAAPKAVYAWYSVGSNLYKFENGYPYLQIRAASPSDFFNCTSVRFKKKSGEWIYLVDGVDGHFQDYFPYGDVGYSRYFHVNKHWYTYWWKAKELIRGNNTRWQMYCQPI